MNTSNLFASLLGNLATQLPTLAVCAAGIALSLVWWRRAPKASLLACLAFALGLAIGVFAPLLQTLILTSVASDPATRGWWFSGLAIFWSILRAGTYVLLLLAVYADRNSRTMAQAVRA